MGKASGRVAVPPCSHRLICWAGECSSCRTGRGMSYEELAQATLEYALTIFALLALVAGLAVVWRAAEAGLFTALIEDSASHPIDGTGVVDIALY